MGFELDSLVVATSIGSGVLCVALGAFMMRRARVPSPVRPLEDVVQSAPYNRLHNVITVDRRG